MVVFIIIVVPIIAIVIYRRNRPSAKLDRAEKEAYLSASTRRCNQFLALDELKIQLGQIV